MDISFGNPEKNFSNVKKYITEAANNNADVIVLPEMWNAGYALNQLEDLADPNGESTKELLTTLSKKYSVNIVGGSVATKINGEFFNTTYVVNRDGNVISDYHKAHLFKLMDEHKYIKAGDSKNLFDIDGIRCGGVICYDIRFPEWIRSHVLNGAQIMFVPAQWPEKRIDHWQLLLQARAIENQCFIIAVNRVGSDPNNNFNGHSMVIGPWGELIVSKNTLEAIFYAELDLNEIKNVRETIPVFQDRREELYKS
jgi:predicted amidohydrolase